MLTGSLMRLFVSPEDRLAISERHAHPLADRVRVFAREGENVGQEGFDSLVHRVSPPYPSRSRLPRAVPHLRGRGAAATQGNAHRIDLKLGFSIIDRRGP